MKPGISTTGKRIKGFTYLAALAALVIVGVSAQTVVTLGSTELQREKELELLFRGKAYQDAIRSYYHAAFPHRYPSSLQDLLKDPRFLNKRHLRRHYPDPMGGEWRLLLDRGGAIIGVASQSKRAPFKQADFPRGFEHLTGAERYSDWIFLYAPGSSSSTNRR